MAIHLTLRFIFEYFLVKGVLNRDYAVARQTKRSHIYRLRRRTFEVLKGIKTFHPEKPGSILDIGTADGLMLHNMKNTFPNATCVGIEYARDLMAYSKTNSIHLIQGDALVLPIKDNAFDVVIATAIIEHVPEPIQLVHEAFRVLRKDGIFIVTTPHPFWEGIATRIGHLKEEEHHELITLKKLIPLFNTAGFDVVNAEQFMISPIGMPFELEIEKVLKLCGLSLLLLNQKIIGKKGK